MTELLAFFEHLRATLRQQVEHGLQNDPRAVTNLFYWYVALGTLSWDVSGSFSLLVQHENYRAAMMLSRSLFEYEIRLRFYTMRPDVAASTIDQIPLRVAKIFTVFEELSPRAMSDNDHAEIKAYLAKGAKSNEGTFSDMLIAVTSKTFADRHSKFYLDRQSGYVHGYETIFIDVMREFLANDLLPQPHWSSEILVSEWVVAKGIESIIGTIFAIRQAQGLDSLRELDDEWNELSKKLPPNP